MDIFNSSSEDNCIKCILLENLGPQRRDSLKIVIFTVIYIIIFVTGILGNLLTLIVILNNQFMYTTTNFCLFNLAVSDFLLIVMGLPQEVISFWHSYPWIFGENFCVLKAMLSETLTYVSIQTIIMFTVERYIAICYPLFSRALSGFKRVSFIIIFIWIISGLSSIPIFTQYSLVYLFDNYNKTIEESLTCGIKAENYNVHWFYLSTIFSFILPMIILTVLYLRIGLTLKKSVNQQNELQSTSNKKIIDAVSKKRIPAIKMLGLEINYSINFFHRNVRNLI